MGLTKKYAIDHVYSKSKTPETTTATESTTVSYYDAWAEKLAIAEAKVKLDKETKDRNDLIEKLSMRLANMIDGRITKDIHDKKQLQKNAFKDIAYEIAKDVYTYGELKNHWFVDKKRNALKAKAESSLQAYGLNLDIEFLATRYGKRSFWDDPVAALADYLCEEKVDVDTRKDATTFLASKNGYTSWQEQDLLLEQIKLDLGAAIKSAGDANILNLFEMVDQYLAKLRPHIYGNAA